jgi:hypothetical protein
MNTYRCPHCGETHEGAPTDRGWTLPDVVWAIPEERREAEARFNTDLCQWKERYFVRCLLPLPFADREGYFGWGVWVEVAKEGFDACLAVYDQDGSNEPRVPGSIANRVPGYSDSIGVSVELQFGPADERPVVCFPEHATCELAQEQKEGIDAGRYHEILESTGVI